MVSPEIARPIEYAWKYFQVAILNQRKSGKGGKKVHVEASMYMSLLVFGHHLNHALSKFTLG
jgi:hypothetical protein